MRKFLLGFSQILFLFREILCSKTGSNIVIDGVIIIEAGVNNTQFLSSIYRIDHL